MKLEQAFLILIIVALTCLLFTGCVAVGHKSAEGEELTYLRLGPQKVDGFEVTKDDGTTVKFNQEADVIEIFKAGLEFGRAAAGGGI